MSLPRIPRAGDVFRPTESNRLTLQRTTRGVCLVQGPPTPSDGAGLTSGPPDSQARAPLLVRSAYYTSPGTRHCQRTVCSAAHSLALPKFRREAGACLGPPSHAPALAFRISGARSQVPSSCNPAQLQPLCGARLAVDPAIRLAGQHRRAGDTAAADTGFFISSRMREEESGQERVLRESRDRQMDTGTETEEGDSSLYGRVSQEPPSEARLGHGGGAIGKNWVRGQNYS